MIFSLNNFSLSPLLGGIAALVQITLLPGILLLFFNQYSKLVSPLSALLLVFSFSVVTSFWVLLLLQLVGLHKKESWILLGFTETIVWLYLILRNRPAESGKTSIFAEIRRPIIHWLTSTIFLVVAIDLLVTIIGHWPGVFEEWDAAVSWNRWALDWTRGGWPHLTWGYPQMIPALWSVIYLLQGSSEMEFLARAWMGLFPLALIAVFFDAFLRWQRMAPLLAGIAMATLLMGPYSNVLDSGYVDVPVAFFTLLTGYWLLLARQDTELRDFWLLAGAVSAAAALLTKQGGMLALIVLVSGLWHFRKHSSEVGHVLALLALLSLPWFLLQWYHGIGENNVHYVTSVIYGTETGSQRLWRALSVTLPALLLPGVNIYLQLATILLTMIGLLLAWRDRLGFFCLTIGLSYILVWALFFSYDARNLLPGLPYLLLASAIGIEDGLISKFNFGSLTLPVREIHFCSRLIVYPSLSLLLLIGAELPGNSKEWDSINTHLKKITGDFEFNQRLINMVNQSGFSGYIFSTYTQMAIIKELQPYFYAHFETYPQQAKVIVALQSNQSFCTIFEMIPDHQNIRYMLLHKYVYPKIIEAALANGSLQMYLQTPVLQLMLVNCPNTSDISKK